MKRTLFSIKYISSKKKLQPKDEQRGRHHVVALVPIEIGDILLVIRGLLVNRSSVNILNGLLPNIDSLSYFLALPPQTDSQSDRRFFATYSCWIQSINYMTVTDDEASVNCGFQIVRLSHPSASDNESDYVLLINAINPIGQENLIMFYDYSDAVYRPLLQNNFTSIFFS